MFFDIRALSARVCECQKNKNDGLDQYGMNTRLNSFCQNQTNVGMKGLRAPYEHCLPMGLLYFTALFIELLAIKNTNN